MKPKLGHGVTQLMLAVHERTSSGEAVGQTTGAPPVEGP